MDGLFDSGSMPALERVVQFTTARHQALVHNIANLSTPGYRPVDLPVERFQSALREAIDRRRSERGGPVGKLHVDSSGPLRFEPTRVVARAEATNDNILFHDRNNRSLEHQMQALAENAMAHNAALEMLKSQFDLLQATIREQA